MDGFLEAGVDFERPNVARIYDYLLGGAHNFAVDRELAHRLLEANPEIRRAAQVNRAFLRRLVTHCLDAGIDQFLDLGSGVPTVGNVHEVARAVEPSARVAYVEFEPVAVAHAEEILEGDPLATITRADVREPRTVLEAPGVADLLDLDRPVAVIACAVLHFVHDDLVGVLEAYRAATAPGSLLGFNHSTDDIEDPAQAGRWRSVRRNLRDSATQNVLRSRDELRRDLGRWRLQDPGLVDITDWPGPRDEAPIGLLGGLARNPG